jgi:hypothetical protein
MRSKEERAPTFQQWRRQFRRLIQGSETSTSLIKRLRKQGCDSAVLEELLYTTVATGKKPLAPLKRKAKEALREVRTLLSELNPLLIRMRKVNAIFLASGPEDLGHGDVLDIYGRRQRFESSPELLASYAQHFERMIALSNVQSVADHGPELTMLATYLCVKAGRPRYKDLIFLLDDAYNCVGLQLKQGEDPEGNIRIALARYRKDHPKTCAAIRESISNYETLPISLRRSLVAHIRGDLSSPELMRDLYHKSGKMSQPKLPHG